MRDWIKVYGLPRTGTNYTFSLINANFIVQQTHFFGWKHAKPFYEIDWTGSDWAKPVGMLRPDHVAKALPIKDEVEEALKIGRFNFVITVKNPYAWYISNKSFSHQIKKDGRTVLDKKFMVWYNERNNQYYEFYQTKPHNTLFVRYEDFYNNGYQDVLKGIGTKFNLKQRHKEFINFTNVIGNPSHLSPKGEHDITKYENGFYLDLLGDEAIEFISKHVDKKLMEFFNYELL